MMPLMSSECLCVLLCVMKKHSSRVCAQYWAAFIHNLIHNLAVVNRDTSITLFSVCPCTVNLLHDTVMSLGILIRSKFAGRTQV